MSVPSLCTASKLYTSLSQPGSQALEHQNKKILFLHTCLAVVALKQILPGYQNENC